MRQPLLKIQERRAKLLRLDAPSKTRAEVIPKTQIEAEIEELQRQIVEQERALRCLRGGTSARELLGLLRKCVGG